MNSPHDNKRTAIAFYELISNDGLPRQAMERYAGGHYRQHNPGAGDGKEPFIECFKRMAMQ